MFGLLKAKLSDWKFKRAFKVAPVMRLGKLFVKEVQGNLYAVDVERIPKKKTPMCHCWTCEGKVPARIQKIGG